MRVSFVALLAATWLAVATTADAAPCLIVTLTGTQGGPQSFNGLAVPEPWCVMGMTPMAVRP
jgi:hypothetical protein